MKYYIYLTVRIVLALISGGATSVVLVSYGVPPEILIAVGWGLVLLLVGVYSTSDAVRGRHRVFIFEAILFGLGTAPFFYMH